MPENKKCKATTKAGKPCKSPPIKGEAFCLSHAPADYRESVGFRADNGKGGRPRNPRAVDILREKLEADIDRVVDPLFDALAADAGMTVSVKGGGELLEMVPDHQTRIKAVRELFDRAYGRPTQVTELSGPDGGAIETLAQLPTDKEYEERYRRGLEEAGLVGASNGNGRNGSG